MSEVFDSLQGFRWAALDLPFTGRSYEFRHEQAEHKFIFRDRELIESLGRKNPTWKYTIPFRESIILPRYRNLFTKAYPVFLRDCQDGLRKALVDPVHGTIQAKCVSLREMLDVNRRDGVDVEVEFIEAPFEDEIFDTSRPLISLPTIAAQVKSFDDKITSGAYPVQVNSEQATLDPFAAIGSIGDQINAAGNKVNATIGDLVYRAKKTEDSINRAKQPRLAVARAQVREIRDMALRAPDHLGVTGNRPIGTYVTKSAVDIASLAGLLSNTAAELVKLNGLLARSPTVKINTSVRYYQAIGAAESVARGATEPLS